MSLFKKGACSGLKPLASRVWTRFELKATKIAFFIRPLKVEGFNLEEYRRHFLPIIFRGFEDYYNY